MLLTDSLQEIGFTSYEARVFAALVKNGTATVATLNADSGVPSSAIYGALKKLEKKGLIEVQNTRPVRYKCLPPEDAVNKLKRTFEDKCDSILLELDSIYQSSAEDNVEEAIWTINGVRNVADNIIQLVGNAQEEILVLSSSTPFYTLARRYPSFIKDYETIMALFNEKIAEGVNVRFVSSTEEEACKISENIPLASVRINLDQDVPCELKSFVIVIDNSEILVDVINEDQGETDLKAIWTNGKEFSATIPHLLNAKWKISEKYNQA